MKQFPVKEKWLRTLRNLGFAAAVFGAVMASAAEEVRTIRLRQDDAQVRFDSKVYELKHASAEELLPFLNSAIQRYNRNSTIRRVTSEKTGKSALLVSTGREFLPLVDQIVTALDRPGRTGSEGGDESSISGTGIARVAYAPRFRAARSFADLVNNVFGSASGAAFFNPETNTIYWRDQTAAAKHTLAWVKRLDQPLPQVRIRLNYYELRDSDLKDWGFDYLAWKNGPGVNVLNLGYNAGGISLNELLEGVEYAFSSTWGLGGVFTAPQIDMSFIRCLQQSGNANVAASAELVMVNTPVGSTAEYLALQKLQNAKPDTAPYIYRISMFPEYQNIAKNTLGRTFIGKSFYEDEYGEKHADPPALEAQLVNPFVCFEKVPGQPPRKGEKPGKDREAPQPADFKDTKAGGVLFDYSLYFKNVVERGNTGAELSNSALVSGATTLAFEEEKVLAIYEKENDVEQTIGLPVLCRIPYLKYLFSTVTTIQERSYIVITAEASLEPLDGENHFNRDSQAAGVSRRIENPFRRVQE